MARKTQQQQQQQQQPRENTRRNTRFDVTKPHETYIHTRIDTEQKKKRIGQLETRTTRERETITSYTRVKQE